MRWARNTNKPFDAVVNDGFGNNDRQRYVLWSTLWRERVSSLQRFGPEKWRISRNSRTQRSIASAPRLEICQPIVVPGIAEQLLHRRRLYS